MEDLTARGAEFGQATDLWSVDDIATTLEVQAKWHAALWGSGRGERTWLPVGAKAARDAFTVMLSPEVFHPLIERSEVPDLALGQLRRCPGARFLRSCGARRRRHPHNQSR